MSEPILHIGQNDDFELESAGVESH